ncbi:PfaD family polyunsaturated fatty acid/polyketide biosynthesis protein [Myxococcota bacterium]|nr:PfaD family polyunsaturated fatty acid/polyketide biosynthesis protein [Myxococcota bacterium]
MGAAFSGQFVHGPVTANGAAATHDVLAVLGPIHPEWLGDRSFTEVHHTRFPYVTGAMANGIATTRLVIEIARAGFLGFFGAAGLGPERVARALDELDAALGGTSLPWGANLIHSPQEPALEAAIAELYLRRGVRRIEASAYMQLTAPIVRYAYSGVRADADGRIHRANHVFAKISRPEVARRFMDPAPHELVAELVARGHLTEREAELARHLPVAEDLTCEADSGGHTDNQALTALFPTIARLRDDIVWARKYRRPIRLGAAGGIGTPQSVAAAFSLGAAYVLTGSVNQACIESGLSAEGRQLLAQAALGDFEMAPAADMFELGVEVQVLKRGTLFAARAKKLYDLYRTHESLEGIGAAEKKKLEADILRNSVEGAWNSTRDYWMRRDPSEVTKAERDPKHKMALVFRSYLGQASRWAISGEKDRRADYQIWCGPAMGAFNAWTAGTFLASPERRAAVMVAKNLMEGAAVVMRAEQLRSAGVPVPAAAFDYRPRELA